MESYWYPSQMFYTLSMFHFDIKYVIVKLHFIPSP